MCSREVFVCVFKLAGVNACSVLRSCHKCADYDTLLFKLTMITHDEKLDSLLKSVAEIQKAHAESRQDLESRFARLEEDVKSSQLEATEKAVKKAKQEQPLEFKKKGHEEQYYFNQDINDCIIAATQQLGRINPSSDRDKTAVEKTIKKLEEGAASIAQRQKFIRIADQS